MIKFSHVMLACFIALVTSAVIAFGPEGNKIFYWFLNLLSLAGVIGTLYAYGYLQHKESTEGVVKVHQINNSARKVRIVEFDDEGAIISSDDYVADSNWLSGFRKIVYK